MVLPEVVPVVVVEAAAVTMSLPAVAVVVSSAVFAGGGGVAADAAPLAEEETVTVGVIFLSDNESELPVESLESVRITRNCLYVGVDESPVVYLRGRLLCRCPGLTLLRWCPLPFLPGGGGCCADAAPLADVEMVTVGVTVLTDAGSELSADFAGAAAVRVAPLAEAGEVTLDVVGLELLSQMDADGEVSPVVAEHIAVGGSARTAVVPVNMVNVQTNTVGDDRFSPGVGWGVPLVRQDCVDMTCEEYRELLEEDSDSSENCGYDTLSVLNYYDPRDYETVWEGSSPGETGDVRLAPVEGGVDGQIMFPGSELPDMPEIVTITSQNVPAVSWTDECATAGFDLAVEVLLLDSYDLIGMTDHPFRVLLLEGASVTRPITFWFGWIIRTRLWPARDPGRLPRLLQMIGWTKCGGHPCLSRIRLILWIWATQNCVFGCRGFEAASGVWILLMRLIRVLTC